jgi:hypothetical protein
MLIEIDRSMSEFDRVCSAIDFRDSFRSRAGSFGSRGFAGGDGFDNCNGIALTIASAATATAARWRTTAVVSRCVPRLSSRRPGR